MSTYFKQTKSSGSRLKFAHNLKLSWWEVFKLIQVSVLELSPLVLNQSCRPIGNKSHKIV